MDTEITKTEPAITDNQTATAITQVAQEKQPYSPEEISDLLTKDANIDTDRLSPEGKLIMKSFQKGLTPKLQDAAETKRRAEELEARLKAVETKQPKDPMETVFESYLQNPAGTIKSIDAEIHRLKNEPNAYEMEDQIEKLRDLKVELKFRKAEYDRGNQNNANGAYQATINEVLDKIPDFPKEKGGKGDKLAEFAVSEMGYTPKEFVEEAHPSRGSKAVKFLIALNKRYDEYLAAKTVADKAKTPITKVEQGGAGNGLKADKTDHAKVYEEMLDKVRAGKMEMTDALAYKKLHLKT